MDIADEKRQLEQARRQLEQEFAGRVPEAQIQGRFAELVAEFEHAPVRSFVPVLVQRRARERLRSQSAS